MALSNAAKGKLLEIYEALDDKSIAEQALAAEHATETAALFATQKTAIKALVVEFKALGGTNADLPLFIQQYLEAFNGNGS